MAHASYTRLSGRSALMLLCVAVGASHTAQSAEAPRAGFKSCAGKIEGRYASTGGAGGSLQITFRSGKASLPGLNGDDEYECWINGDKVYLHKVGASPDTDMPIDINDDGTLQTPMGDIKKKGK